MSSPPTAITEWSQRAIRDIRHGDLWAKWVFELDRGQRLRSAVVEAAGALALVRAADLDLVSVMFFIPAGYPASDEEPFPTFDVDLAWDDVLVPDLYIGRDSALGDWLDRPERWTGFLDPPQELDGWTMRGLTVSERRSDGSLDRTRYWVLRGR